MDFIKWFLILNMDNLKTKHNDIGHLEVLFTNNIVYHNIIIEALIKYYLVKNATANRKYFSRLLVYKNSVQ